MTSVVCGSDFKMFKEVLMILLLCVQSSLIGYTVGKKKKTNTPEFDPETEQKIKKVQKELQNFYTYDG